MVECCLLSGGCGKVVVVEWWRGDGSGGVFGFSMVLLFLCLLF